MAPVRRIDFNCDLGEGCGNDAAVMPFISSASIACGGHAGDVASMRQAVALCLQHNVAIGAHPSFADREHFGRRELDVAPQTLRTQLREQIETLAAVCDQQDTRLRHVKPHGALYNLAARDAAVARVMIDALRDVDPSLALFALSGSRLAELGEAAGLHVAHEVFAERRYDADGRLAPRDTEGAVIVDLDAALEQVHGLLRDGCVVARDGAHVRIRADTLCLHGDRADAAVFAHAVRAALRADHVDVVAFGKSNELDPDRESAA